MPVLRIKLPNAPVVEHQLTGERITIGRRADNVIQILDRSVSAYHAELLLEEGHYLLHDLESTNLSFVEGAPVTDFHLHNSCALKFGTIECEFHATTEAERRQTLTPAQMEKDLSFLRSENQDLLHKIDGLQRRVDILSSARLVTGKTETAGLSPDAQVKKLTAERDELRFQASGLKLELEKLRNELSETIRERDNARRESDLLQAAGASKPESEREKDATQRIHLFPHAPSEPGAVLQQEGDGRAVTPLFPKTAAGAK